MEIRMESLSGTKHVGRALGELLRPGDIICLSGQLGAGKTTFARHLAAGWGTTDPVTSPTFSLVNAYAHPHRSETFFHVDAYRLASAREAQTLGLEDLLEEKGVMLVEWPERIADELPPDRLWITMTAQGDDGRIFRLRAEGQRSSELLAAFKQRMR